MQADTINLTASSTLTSRGGGNITITGAIDTSGTGGNHALTIDSRNTLTLNSNINTGSGALTLSGAGSIGNGGVPRTLTASTVSLTQVGAFGDTALFTFTTPSLILTTATAQTVHDWMVAGTNRDLSLTSTGGAVIVNENINLGTGALTLSGAGSIGNGGVPRTLTASTVSLTQVDAFGDTALFTFTTDTLNLTTGADQIVHNAWMVVDDRNLSLTSTGGAVIVNDNINIGTGNITLNGMGGITLGGMGVRRLIGGGDYADRRD